MRTNLQPEIATTSVRTGFAMTNMVAFPCHCEGACARGNLVQELPGVYKLVHSNCLPLRGRRGHVPALQRLFRLSWCVFRVWIATRQSRAKNCRMCTSLFPPSVCRLRGRHAESSCPTSLRTHPRRRARRPRRADAGTAKCVQTYSLRLPQPVCALVSQ